jgi:hypothetical protein
MAYGLIGCCCEIAIKAETRTVLATARVENMTIS